MSSADASAMCCVNARDLHQLKPIEHARQRSSDHAVMDTKLHKAVMNLAHKARAGREDQHGEVSRSGGGCDRRNLMRLASASTQLYEDTADASAHAVSHFADLVQLVGPKALAHRGQVIKECGLTNGAHRFR